MPENTEENKSIVELAGEDLFNFAVDREDIKTLIYKKFLISKHKKKIKIFNFEKNKMKANQLKRVLVKRALLNNKSIV